MDRERNFYLRGLEKRLQNANILVVGLGGVGSFAAEFWPGRWEYDNVDGDVVDITNINRQLPAHSTIGLPKITIVGTD
jgi:tRNA A37 threonylcarbamoyladenosine dehydratase